MITYARKKVNSKKQGEAKLCGFYDVPVRATDISALSFHFAPSQKITHITMRNIPEAIAMERLLWYNL